MCRRVSHVHLNNGYSTRWKHFCMEKSFSCHFLYIAGTFFHNCYNHFRWKICWRENIQCYPYIFWLYIDLWCAAQLSPRYVKVEYLNKKRNKRSTLKHKLTRSAVSVLSYSSIFDYLNLANQQKFCTELSSEITTRCLSDCLLVLCIWSLMK